MNIVIVIAGIADPKVPIPAAIDAARLSAHVQRHAALSPFDEAALELALKLRDAVAGTVLHGVVLGPEAIARKVAEHRLDSVRRLEMPVDLQWDTGAVAGALAGAVRSLPAADLVLIGKEVGDCDDGVVPALLAHALDLSYHGMVMAARMVGGVLWAIRQGQGHIEKAAIEGRSLLAVVNNPQNRLRHPLMKNVMAARRAPIELWADDGQPAAAMHLDGIAANTPPPRSSECRMLKLPLPMQSAELARLLFDATRGGR
jgi:electron transfer flavoprotein beta subunit